MRVEGLDAFQFQNSPRILQGLTTGKAGVLVPGGACQRELFPICAVNPICIIWIRLRPFPRRGQPPIIIEHYLAPYLQDDVILIDMEFDFKDAAAHGRYSDGIDALVHDLSKGGKLERLAICQNPLLFLTIHNAL